MSLSSIIKQRGHAKCSHYFDVYDSILSPLRDQPIRLLELGVGEGNSLRLWNDYFTQAEIIGIDNQPEYSAHIYPRAKSIFGDQTDIPFLSSLGSFNIIIDDGGHTMSQQIISYSTLFSQLLPGGWYFIEDLNSSYAPDVIRHFGLTTIDYLKPIIDTVNTSTSITELRFVRDLVAIHKKDDQ